MGMGIKVSESVLKRAAEEIKPGMIVNLGIGIPSLVPEFVACKNEVFFQAENGILGMGDSPEKGLEDENLCNAGGFPVTLQPGGSYFDSSMAFAMIRKRKIDITILGALQVSQNGDLANWIVPGKKVPGMGGAIELAGYAKKVIVTMTHQDKKGISKIVRECSLPLTSGRCVDLIITEMGVFEVQASGGLLLTEVFGPYSEQDIAAATDADYQISSKCKYREG